MFTLFSCVSHSPVGVLSGWSLLLPNFLQQRLIVFELVKDFSDVSEIRASYRVKNCPTLVPTSLLNPVHIVTRCISVTYMFLLPSLLQIYLENSLYPAGLPSKILYAFLLTPLHPTRLIHLSSSLTSLYVILTTVVHPLGIYLQFCILTFNFANTFLISRSSMYDSRDSI